MWHINILLTIIIKMLFLRQPDYKLYSSSIILWRVPIPECTRCEMGYTLDRPDAKAVSQFHIPCTVHSVLFFYSYFILLLFFSIQEIIRTFNVNMNATSESIFVFCLPVFKSFWSCLIIKNYFGFFFSSEQLLHFLWALTSWRKVHIKSTLKNSRAFNMHADCFKYTLFDSFSSVNTLHSENLLTISM